MSEEPITLFIRLGRITRAVVCFPSFNPSTDSTSSPQASGGQETRKRNVWVGYQILLNRQPCSELLV